MNIDKFLIAYIPSKYANKSCNWLTNDNDSYYHSVDPIDFPDSIIQRIFTLYNRTYKGFGNLLIKNSYGLLECNRWILFYDGNIKLYNTVKPDDIIAFTLFKVKRFGLKTILAGSDGSNNGKRAVINFAIESYNTHKIFGEISNPLEDKIINNIPIVPFQDAKNILIKLGKNNINKTVGEHYKRNINNLGMVEKIMVGRPIYR